MEVDTKAPTIVTLQDNTTIAWDEATKEDLLPTTKKTVTMDLKETTTSPLLSHDGVISAMTKLLTCMIKHQEAKLRFKEEKADNRLKTWKKLPRIRQKVLLLGGGWKKTAVSQKISVRKCHRS